MEDLETLGQDALKVTEGSAVKEKHPTGLYILFMTEMWERFSYYGMRAIFTLYMIKALMFDKSLTSVIYGNYTSLVYLTPLLGGYIADRYWGNRRSIFVGAIMMAIAQFTMFASAMFYSNVEVAKLLMYAGLVLPNPWGDYESYQFEIKMCEE